MQRDTSAQICNEREMCARNVMYRETDYDDNGVMRRRNYVVFTCYCIIVHGFYMSIMLKCY